MRAIVTVILAAFERDKPQTLPAFPFEVADLDDDAVLGRLFRLLNHVMPGDAERMPTGGRHRSLSCGDYVVLHREGGEPIKYACAPVGWRRCP
jgi:hypothetical protein